MSSAPPLATAIRRRRAADPPATRTLRSGSSPDAADIFADRAPVDAAPTARVQRIAELLQRVSETGKAENDVAIELPESGGGGNDLVGV